MGDFSTHYDLGQINAYTTNQEFLTDISPDARPVGVICKNQGYEACQLTLVCIESGQSIAQLVIAPVPCLQVKLVDELISSERGCGGFGSTGI